MSGSASCPPHDQQKRFPLDTSARQCGQIRASRAPQSSQNLAPAGFVAWHRGHRIEQVAKETNGDAGEPGEYTECRRRNSSAESSGGNRAVSLHASVQFNSVQMDDALPRWSKTNCATAPATCDIERDPTLLLANFAAAC